MTLLLALAVTIGIVEMFRARYWRRRALRAEEQWGTLFDHYERRDPPRASNVVDLNGRAVRR